jgi:cyclic pyranopterin phosphate synthase
MTDAYGRPITYLRLSVTDLCNLRCTYCMPPEGVCKREHSEICSIEELAELAGAFVGLGIQKIRLTGGEPLVRRGIVSLVEKLNALRPLGLEELCLTTNGILLPDLAAPLRTAGMDRLNVSLDTLRPDRYRALTRGGELDRVLEGLAAAEAAGFRDLRLNAVLLKGVNDGELRDLALLAKDRPWSVRFIELMPIGPGAALEFLPAEAVLEAVPELRKTQNEATGDGGTEKTIPLGAELSGGQRDFNTICAAELRKWYPTPSRWHPASPASRMTDERLSDGRTRSRDLSNVARYYTAPGWAGTVGLITPMSCGFCTQCNRVRLTADGKLKPCLHSPEEYPLRGLRGDELQAAILAAIQRKPERHRLSETNASESARPMNEIGG